MSYEDWSCRVLRKCEVTYNEKKLTKQYESMYFGFNSSKTLTKQQRKQGFVQQVPLAGQIDRPHVAAQEYEKAMSETGFNIKTYVPEGSTY